MRLSFFKTIQDQFGTHPTTTICFFQEVDPLNFNTQGSTGYTNFS